MSRVGPAQMKKLLDLLSKDGVLVNGKVSYTNTNKQHFWKRIAIQLNSVEGGVYKNTWKWCKMWADWKAKTKKKANILLRRSNNSMGQPIPSLTDLELRLLKIVNYPLDDKADVQQLEMGVNKVEPQDQTESPVDFLSIEYNESQPVNSSSDDDMTLESYDRLEKKFTKDFDGQQSSGMENKVMKDELFMKKLPIEEYKIITTLKLEKERVQQKNEELRLRALELKLKGDELRLKETEMNKINNLTNIEEEKLKCFRDISSSLKELLNQTKTGSLRFHNGL